jgi:ABC-2 type transport system permease protein
MISQIFSISKRELKGYFGSPVAYVFIFFFLVLCGFFTFQFSGLYESNQASLRAFFVWQPWLYLFLIPAVGMRLWAEERRSRTIEILLTLPVTVGQAVVGKFIAAWLFVVIALLLTFPLVLTVSYLGDPDMGAIFTGYLGCFLMAGAYLAVGSLMSSLTRSQVIGFILSVVLCLLLVISGWPPITSWLSQWLSVGVVDFIANLSFITHFESIQRGVIDTRDIVYYASVIFFMLFANTAVLTMRKA